MLSAKRRQLFSTKYDAGGEGRKSGVAAEETDDEEQSPARMRQ
jgi:hypothetical protein